VDRRQLLREAGLVVAVAAFQLFTAHAGDERFAARAVELDALGTGLLLLGPLSLPLRHRTPWLTMGTAVLAGIVYFSLGYPGAAIFATVVVALFSLFRRRRAEQRALEEQERSLRAEEERLSVARDLHDVLAHTLSVVQVQAGVALHLLDERPEHVRGALTAIKRASDEGMQELRAAVATLRREGEGATPLAPVSGLADLPRLVAGAQAAGLQVHLTRRGADDGVPAATGLVAYRVVQEALTNAVRHAAARSCEVEVAVEGDLRVRVRDDGVGGVAAPGNGLRGMRERVEALGGTLSTGPAADGGFEVRAVLPAGHDVGGPTG
jgi:signal transduction histidine kinase